MKNKNNQKIIPHENQIIDLGVMIDRCFLDSQHGGSNCHPANVSCSFSSYTNNDLSNHTNQRLQRRKWTREENKVHCYFRRNPTMSGYRKRMIEIWEECVRFKTTNPRLTDKTRMIIKKGSFSDLEI